MKRFLIPLVLVLIHAALVILIGTLIALSPDGEAEMAWAIFLVIDFPVSLCIFAQPSGSLAIPILLLGTIQWGIIGIVVQTIVNSFRRGKGTEHGDQ